MGKIGAKSAAFINHKPFHPGNLQNLEKVWIAEQKEKERKKAQEELLERRQQEFQIEELRRTIRKRDFEVQQALAASDEVELISSASASKKRQIEEFDVATLKPGLNSKDDNDNYITDSTWRLLRDKRRKKEHKLEKASIKSRYREDVLSHGHTAVWGSYYSKVDHVWGYACCKLTQRCAKCLHGKATKK